jgi:hypothetical protein
MENELITKFDLTFASGTEGFNQQVLELTKKLWDLR